MEPSPRKRYLFVRILEACNADCFMCEYALSRDQYRFTPDDFRSILPTAQAMNVGFVRFTGGEPLLHKDLEELLRLGAEAGMQMSLITNGHVLPKRVDRLAEAGLAQVIVSIDGSSPQTHDVYRNTPGLFDRCSEGLVAARERGIRTRVNTVVGPHNYRQMPELQQHLTSLGIQQWELSALKLERAIEYADPDDVRAVCHQIYSADAATTLVPMGKRFCGGTPEEEARFFEKGFTPGPTPPRCNLVGDVIYIDAKAGRGFGCSLLPHREADQSGGGVVLRDDDGRWTLDPPELEVHVREFRVNGPFVCRGCSTTAAGYSDDVARLRIVGDWTF